MISAVMMLMACGGQSKKETSDADSTQVFEVPDTLNTVDEVVKQVNAVYAYWNQQREHSDENAPTLAVLSPSSRMPSSRAEVVEPVAT